MFIILLCIGTGLLGQEVKSAKTSFRISNMPVVEAKVIPDTNPPTIKFITPPIYPGTRFHTDKNNLELIARVSDSSGISFVSFNSEIQTLNDAGIFSTMLELELGDNSCHLTTMDKNENLKEINFLVNYTPPVVSLAEKISAEATYYGLIIGINDYRDKDISDLSNPISDAGDLKKVLVDLYQFQEENIRFLKDATRADIIRTLDELAHLITPEDNLLIFYAGHGWWDENANNGYWLPADSHQGEKTNWFRNSTLVDYLKEIESKHTLLITDACFGGSIFETRSAFGNQDKAYEKLYELTSRKAMTSGRLTEVPDKSKFAEFLIAKLKDNDQTYLSSEELYSEFRMNVINNSDAVPRFGEIRNVGDAGGDFIFLKKQSEK